MPLDADNEFLIWELDYFDDIVDRMSVDGEVVHGEVDFEMMDAINENFVLTDNFVELCFWRN